MRGLVAALSGSVGNNNKPSLSLTSPTFTTTNAKFGAAALTGGSGSVTLTNSNSTIITAEFWAISTSCPAFQNPVFSLEDGEGNYVALVFSQNNGYYLNSSNASTSGFSSIGSQGSSSWVFVAIQTKGVADPCDIWVNGTNCGNSLNFDLNNTNNLSIALNMANGLTGLDNLRISNVARYTAGATTITVPSEVNTRVDSNVIALYDFDSQNGNQT